MGEWKIELSRTTLLHNVWQAYYRANERTDICILALLLVSQLLVTLSLVLNFQKGVIWAIALCIATTALNVGNAIVTIKRMIERRKDMKEEQELYELARQALLELEKKLEVES